MLLKTGYATFSVSLNFSVLDCFNSLRDQGAEDL